MLNKHKPDDADYDNGMKNNKGLQQPYGPACQINSFYKNT